MKVLAAGTILAAAREATRAPAAPARDFALTTDKWPARFRTAPTAAVLAMIALSLAAMGCASAERGVHHHDGHPHHHHHHHDDPHHHHHQHHGHDHHVDHADLHPAHDPSAPCTCTSAIRLDRWCRRCNIGFVAGVPVESALLFSTLDPHGHELDLNSLACRDCRRAIAEDEFCDDCGMGFIKGLAYFTRLTHGLAKGRSVDPERLACATCRASSKQPRGGWCGACARGMVGNVAFTDRAVFDRTAHEFATFNAAVEKSRECELCACAMVVHRVCPNCRIAYERQDH